jgi:hypothetical protein
MSAGRFGISDATRSPGFSPRPSRLTARRSLRSSSVRHVQRLSAEISVICSGIQIGVQEIAGAGRSLQRRFDIPGHAGTPVRQINSEPARQGAAAGTASPGATQ